MKTLLSALCLLTASAFAQVTVSISTPLASSNVSAPIHLHATASSSHPITGWHVYLDGKDVYSTTGTTAIIDMFMNATAGTHTIVVRSWDTTGASGDKTLSATVASSNTATPPPPTTTAPTAPTSTAGLPTPPSNAKVFTNIDQMSSGWGACNSSACAGGNGSGAYWQAFNQTSPSLDGNSMQIYHDGVWGNALWYKKLGSNDYATNFLWDFYVQLDNNSLTSGQSLEYDAFQFVAGYNYMIGTQCNYGAGVWDTWNEATGHWLHTSIPCPKFTPGTWHHIQWYMTTNHTNHTYTYKTLVVDGKIYNLNQTQPAKYLAWGSNVGVQWQLDVNAKGTGYHEWVDQAKFTIW